MLGLLLLYLIGRQFYDLARRHGRNGWGLALLGIAAYYLGIFVAGVTLALVLEALETAPLDSFNDTVLGLLMLPFGILSCYLVYRLLDQHFRGIEPDRESVILDDGFEED